jgi:WD40 repeat protein/serine/threonine protein kinase/tetratricopeptide (TPR) repeat protein
LIGPYKLLEPIGEGGMGVVYMAEQTQPVRRKVALKIIKPGMDTRQVVARFEAERQALALMDHANIARVLDAGTTASGRPYFAMELVRGIPITEYCDRNRLSIDGRLELFAQVCQAVQHAHQKAIIHRDLKPSNILVTLIDGSAVPKIIDFGVAKAIGHSLTDKTLYTSFAQFIGTPLYMSPEQAEFSGVDVDTRSDIYSLGVLLYELLTGTTPFDQETFRTASYDEVRRIIREQEPPKPSTRIRLPLRRGGREGLPPGTLKGTQTTVSALRQSDPRRLRKSLHGELDWIVMKCLEKDRNRRYETANTLVADVRRYLNHQPVEAGPPSAGYRLRKFARRNRAALLTTALVATALVAVAVLAVLDARRQRRFGLAQAKSLADSNRLLAIRNYDRGQAACEQGEIGPGLLWIVESWRSAVDAGDPVWQHAARANLAHWRPHYPRLKAVLSHTIPVMDVVFSPDCRTAISVGLDGAAQLWDVGRGQRIGPLLRPEGGFFLLVFSPDGKAVVAGAERTIQLWDTTSGQPYGPPLHLRRQDRILAATIQRDGKIVVAASEPNEDNVARFWDATTGQPIFMPLKDTDPISGLAFSPDGKTVVAVSGDRRTARLWDATTGRPKSRPLTQVGPIGYGFFSTDGKTLVTVSDYRRTVRLWDARIGKPVGLPVRHESQLRAVAFSPDGKTLFTGYRDGTGLLCDAATGKPSLPPLKQEDGFRSAAFSPDGKTLLTGGQDTKARLWDTATGQLIGLLEHQSGVPSVAYSADGTTLLTASLDGTVRVWDAEFGPPLRQVLDIPTTDRIFGWSPNRKVAATFPQEPNAQRHVQLWDATTQTPVAIRIPQPGGNQIVKLSTDGKVVVTTEMNHTARLWNTATGRPLGPAFQLPGEVDAGGVGPDGKTLWFSTVDKVVWLFDGITGTIRGCTPALASTAYGLAFRPDGKTFLTGQATGEMQFWDAATLAPLGKPFSSPGVATGPIFSPDGKSLLIGHESGGVWLWDLASGRPLIPPLRHLGPAEGAFSPNGRTIVTGSQDKTARLWDAATGQPLGPVLRQPDPLRSFGFIDDGQTVFVGCRAARLYPVPPDLPDDLQRVATWVEVITGLTLDKEHGLVQVLDNTAWLERRERLMQLGGPPETGPEPRLDPILFGPDPTARARSFMDRKQWPAAEAAFDEALRARPSNLPLLIARGDLYAARGLWSEAAAYYATTVKQFPDLAPLHEQLAVTRLLAGDLPGYRAACAAMLEQHQAIDDSIAAVRVAYACSLAPDAVCDRAGLLQVAERSTRWVTGNQRGVGAVLFRSGRLEEALKRFEEAHAAFQPRAWDWLFLAMIHVRLGHPDQARQLLAQADQWIASADQRKPSPDGEAQSGWSDEFERPTILLLRREAESMVHNDCNLPSDPFAR